jgi:hypothetical protein
MCGIRAELPISDIPRLGCGAHGGVSNVAAAGFFWLLDLPLVIVGIDGGPTMLTRRSCRIH